MHIYLDGLIRTAKVILALFFAFGIVTFSNSLLLIGATKNRNTRNCRIWMYMALFCFVMDFTKLIIILSERDPSFPFSYLMLHSINLGCQVYLIYIIKRYIETIKADLDKEKGVTLDNKV